MALGSLAALTPVELVFMKKKKKKKITPGWSHQGDQLLEKARRHLGLGTCTGWSVWASGSIVPIYPWPTRGPLFP